MIALRVATMAAVATTVLGLAVAARFVARRPLPEVGAVAATVALMPLSSVPSPLSPDSLADAAARRDPFRLTRTAAPERFSASEPANPYEAPRPPRQSPVLVGITVGQERMALLDGLPGIEGTRVVREGERVGDILVRRIAGDRVVIVAPDTTWTLTVRRSVP